MTDKMREQFEAWAEETREYWLDKNECDLLGEPVYDHPAAQADWDLWQASRACIEVELPTTSCSDSAHSLGWNECLFECEAAIESHGLRVKT